MKTRLADLQLFIGEIFRTHVHDHRDRKTPIRLMNFKSSNDFLVYAENYRHPVDFTGIFSFFQTIFYFILETGWAFLGKNPAYFWPKTITKKLFFNFSFVMREARPFIWGIMELSICSSQEARYFGMKSTLIFST